jgi:hypothetical protein
MDDKVGVFEYKTIWRFRVLWWAWKIYAQLRYWLTGDCGCACGWAGIRDLRTGERELVFIPEAECPIHDRQSH